MKQKLLLNYEIEKVQRLISTVTDERIAPELSWLQVPKKQVCYAI